MGERARYWPIRMWLRHCATKLGGWCARAAGIMVLSFSPLQTTKSSTAALVGFARNCNTEAEGHNSIGTHDRGIRRTGEDSKRNYHI